MSAVTSDTSHFGDDPMSVQFTPDLAALAGRPDFEVTPPEEPDPGIFVRLKKTVASAALFLGTTFAVAGLFFIPVLFFNLSRIEALEIAGQQLTATAFLGQLGALFWGTFVLALAFTSFVASMLIFASGRLIRPYSKPVGQEDAMAHLTVLRLSGSER